MEAAYPSQERLKREGVFLEKRREEIASRGGTGFFSVIRID